MNRKLVYLARHLDIFHRRTPPRLQRIVDVDRKYYRQDLRHIRRDYRWTTAPRICGLGNISWPLLPDNALPSCIAILLPPLLSSSSRCPGRRMVFRSREEAREGRLNWKYVIRQCVKSSVSFRILLRLSPSETCRFLFYRAEPPVPSWRKNVSRVNKFLAYFSSPSSFPAPF